MMSLSSCRQVSQKQYQEVYRLMEAMTKLKAIQPKLNLGKVKVHNVFYVKENKRAMDVKILECCKTYTKCARIFLGGKCEGKNQVF